MNDLLALFLTFIFGMLLGALFFGGLFLTVIKGTQAKRPALWFILSFIIRIGVVVVGIYAVSSQEWQRIVACLVGFILVRCICTSIAKRGCRNES